jgi:hypothetical protein
MRTRGGDGGFLVGVSNIAALCRFHSGYLSSGQHSQRVVHVAVSNNVLH